jgi:uncharacterized protein
VEERTYDGQTLKQAFKAAELLLEKRIDEVNALNVFPVPDGDTGINMYLTLQSANDAVKENTSLSAAEISAKASMGALLGARGNSGVIFSQIMRGLAKGLEKKERFTAADFAQALQQASNTAYKAIAEPVEGTILTVIREASEIAMQQARQGADLKRTITAVTSQAKDTVTRTPEMLPTLKDAGVVDAGGKGLFYFFLGMKTFMCEKMNPVEGYKAAFRKVQLATAETSYGYDLQFLVKGVDLPIAEMQEKINTLGVSVLVVGDESLVRVHAHTQQPQVIMDYCATKGTLTDIISDNMDNQVKKFKSRRNGNSKNSKRNGNGHKSKMSNLNPRQFNNAIPSP